MTNEGSHLGHCLVDKGLSDANGDDPWGSCIEQSLAKESI